MFDNCELQILEIGELMEMLNIGRNTAYRLLNDGEIKAIRIGNRWKIPRSSIDTYISKQIL